MERDREETERTRNRKNVEQSTEGCCCKVDQGILVMTLQSGLPKLLAQETVKSTHDYSEGCKLQCLFISHMFPVGL